MKKLTIVKKFDNRMARFFRKDKQLADDLMNHIDEGRELIIRAKSEKSDELLFLMKAKMKLIDNLKAKKDKCFNRAYNYCSSLSNAHATANHE